MAPARSLGSASGSASLPSLPSSLSRDALVILGYAVASSSLSLINKWALVAFNYPNALLQLQLLTSALTAWLIGVVGAAYVDPFSRSKVWQFLPAVLVFYVTCYTNMKLLQHVNVDTFIVVRSCSPLAVYAVDGLRLLSSSTSTTTAGVPIMGLRVRVARFIALVATCASAALYAGATSADFTGAGCIWSAAYLVSITVSSVLVKGVVLRVALSSWGLVLFNNALSVMLLPFSMASSLDRSQPWLGLEGSAHGMLTDLPRAAMPIAASCLLGTAISWFGLQARQVLSPTSFAVVGVVNKGLTVCANLWIWDRHSSPIGTVWLAVCLACAMLFELAPKFPLWFGDRSRRSHTS